MFTKVTGDNYLFLSYADSNLQIVSHKLQWFIWVMLVNLFTCEKFDLDKFLKSISSCRKTVFTYVFLQK